MVGVVAAAEVLAAGAAVSEAADRLRVGNHSTDISASKTETG